MTRGVLKLDFLANLEYFTILAFIMLNNEYKLPEEPKEYDPNFDYDAKMVPNWVQWILFGALFLLLVLANMFGGCSTVSLLITFISLAIFCKTKDVQGIFRPALSC